ncbi:hypothetical protein [Spirilliplanes yamanashiensis]|uniref:hypothetical protein n=1 Tax=Spirilliplanes yamanashiensis TaxID=42233 RepID=UPI00194F09E7|nr:hypothetical protein [Spirilliplanes yamanashiensis]MDP9818330.1 hypothetical protein [Spirilliplanes yamanashiensis]
MTALSYQAAAVEALPNWRDRERVELKTMYLLGYRQSHPAAGPHELYTATLEFDSAWRKVSSSPTAERIRDRYEVVHLLTAVVDEIPLPGRAAALQVLKKVGEEYLRLYDEPAAMADAALRDRVAADSVAATVDRTGIVNGSGDSFALLHALAGDDPALLEAAERAMAELPSLRADLPTLIAGSPLLRQLDQLGLLKGDVAEIKANLDRYAAEVGGRLSDLVTVAGQIRTDTRSISDKQDALLAYMTNADLKRQIEAAEAVEYQARVQGAAAAVGLLASIVGLAKPEIGQVLQTSGTAVIRVVEAIGTFRDASRSLDLLDKIHQQTAGARLMSGVRLTADVFSAVMSVVTVITGLTQGDPVLGALTALRDELRQFREEMDGRLDQIDAKLGDIQDDMLNGFTALLNAVGQVGAGVTAIHDRVLALADRINQVERGVYETAVAVQRADVVRDLDRATSTVGQSAFSYERFVDIESRLFTAATDQATTSPAVRGPDGGAASTPPDRDAALAAVEAELARFPAGANIRYLAEDIPRLLGVPALAGRPAANPVSWALAAQAWADLVRAWPGYAARAPGLADRAAALAAVGTGLNATVTSLSGPAGRVLLTALLDRYDQELTALSTGAQEVVAAHSAPVPTMPKEQLWLFTPLPQVPRALLPSSRTIPVHNSTYEIAKPVPADFYSPVVQLAHVLQHRNPANRLLGNANVRLEPVWEELTYTSTPQPRSPSDPFPRYAVTARGYPGAIVHERVGEREWNSYHLDYRQLGEPQVAGLDQWSLQPDHVLLTPPVVFLERVPWSKLRTAWGSGAILSTLIFGDEMRKRMAPLNAAVQAELAAMRAEAHQAVAAAMRHGTLADTTARLSSISALVREYGTVGLPRTLGSSDLLASVITGSNQLYTETGVHQFSAVLTTPAAPEDTTYRVAGLVSEASARSAAVRTVLDSYYAAAAAGDVRESVPVVDATVTKLDLAVAAVQRAQEEASPVRVAERGLAAGDVDAALAALLAAPDLDPAAVARLAVAAQQGATIRQQQTEAAWQTADTAQRQDMTRAAVAADVLARVLGAQGSGAEQWLDTH